MPSLQCLWSTEFAGRIIRTSCPRVDFEAAREACRAQLMALHLRHTNFLDPGHPKDSEMTELRARLEKSLDATKKGGYPPKSKPATTSLPLFSMIPTGPANTLATKQRHFRILAWNLENFTRDRRPKGTQPMESVRNQARIAIIVELLRLFEIDLLLVMETGSDCGTALSAIASRLQDKWPAEFDTHPLVSPPTGALPFVKNNIRAVQPGRPLGYKVLALRTLFEVYHVSTCAPERPVTAAQHETTGCNRVLV